MTTRVGPTGMKHSTCRYCGTDITNSPLWPDEWHAEPNTLGEHYVNVCSSLDAPGRKHAPLDEH